MSRRNYDNHRKWKGVEAKGGREYLNDYEEYSLEEVLEILKRLLKSAEEEGLENCSFSFESHTEPYEDCLGSPSVSVYGYRELTQREKDEVKEQEALEKFAKDKGITIYEASILMKLKDEGKL